MVNQPQKKSKKNENCPKSLVPAELKLSKEWMLHQYFTIIQRQGGGWSILMPATFDQETDC